MAGRPRTRSGAIAWVVCLLSVAAGLSAGPVDASIHHHRWQAHTLPDGWTDPDKDAALVIDGSDGKVLYERNADALRHPASLTKMMTLYLLFEQLKSGQMTLATPIPVSWHAASQSPTKLHVRPGDTVPADIAIRALVVLSANDIAVAIAEAVGGTEGHFAEMMTEKARELGMTHTFYHNASGLPDPLQITTASDLAILARHLAYDFPQYFHYFATPSFVWRGIPHFTHDNLIGRYDGADGIKTGYTNASGFNLVSSVVRNDVHVIGVVMGGVTARRRDAEMVRLLDETFVSISANPQMVARANVPWQALAANAPTAPMIAGFQLGGSLAPASPANPVTADLSPHPSLPSGADDEDAAESRPDPELDAQIQASASGGGVKQPPAVVMEQLPAKPAPSNLPPSSPPPPVRVAMVTVPPPVTRESTPPVPRPQEPLIRVQPEPRPHPVVLAAYHPQAQQVAPITPKLRAATAESGKPESPGVAQPATGESQWAIQIGAYGDQGTAKAQLAAYAERSMDVLGQADRQIIAFQSAEGRTLYRARFGPFPEREAREVCQRLTERGQTCFAALAQK